jgi:hypothetical protein
LLALEDNTSFRAHREDPHIFVPNLKVVENFAVADRPDVFIICPAPTIMLSQN